MVGRAGVASRRPEQISKLTDILKKYFENCGGLDLRYPAHRVNLAVGDCLKDVAIVCQSNMSIRPQTQKSRN